MPYEVEIRRNSDGALRRVPITHDWRDEDESERFWWTDGNAGCDCLRSDLFADAAGEPRPATPCGEVAYSVIRAILPDGSERQVDG